MGEYKTKPRILIVEFLKNNPDKRFTVRDILNAVNAKNPEADKTTVYRNINKLCNEGRLVKYKEPNVKATCYQYSEDHGSCKEHTHAQCSECGKIFHMENEVFNDAAKKMHDEYGIDINFSKTVIIGTCLDCSKKKKNKKHP